MTKLLAGIHSCASTYVTGRSQLSRPSEGPIICKTGSNRGVSNFPKQGLLLLSPIKLYALALHMVTLMYFSAKHPPPLVLKTAKGVLMSRCRVQKLGLKIDLFCQNSDDAAAKPTTTPENTPIGTSGKSGNFMCLSYPLKIHSRPASSKLNSKDGNKWFLRL